ncbi:aldehyde dehydrogenase family protein [Dyella mobilis]|uniref:Aldehyde dehydrogenase family protein n=1 Tax=Dyella mobilis TaxID=1849582 RepID=A0ABS2KJM5_9GAMM|nr:aldehyde dehydrogenase family protein [Dyella mobilis]MBM7131128.1 aldehyde dehydrogenase family protein [Dyella mobilis]GLQ98938.1 ketoglutarate semialdehyde dehydrogenase [Dyella mobilis]
MSTFEPVLIAGNWRAPLDPQGSFRADDPARAETIGPAFPISGQADIEAALCAAVAAADALSSASPERIADFLERYADAIEADADQLVALAHAETALPAEPRLRSVELPRTSNQLRLAAKAVCDNAWTDPVIDTRLGLRAHRAPLNKPVLVFGPNNFPFAFNAIAGSDFASAIAARNPVLAKAHSSHPATSQRLAQRAHEALLAAGLPAASVQMLYHFDNALGLHLAGDTRLGAIGFTGSRTGGLALKAAADKAGVPMYAELSSVNPVFLLPGALAERGDALAQEFFTSCTMGSGQFCTNPGIVIVPRGRHGDAFVAASTKLFAETSSKVLFSHGVQQNLARALEGLLLAGAELLVGGSGDGFRFDATLLSVEGKTFLSHAQALQAEAFGPLSLIIRVEDVTEMAAIAAAFEGNLTGTIYRADNGSDDDGWHAVAAPLRARVGRLIANKMPTGVAVSPAMNHGGPYPSTGHPGFTAVGMPAAIHRFTALHCYDGVADALLPPELRNHNPQRLQRLIDGRWSEADIQA